MNKLSKNFMNFIPLRHPDGEIKRGYLNVLLKDVTIIYYSNEGKSSFKPFELQRSGLFRVFTKNVHSLAVESISLKMSVAYEGVAIIRVDYFEYDKDTMSEDTTVEFEVERAKVNGTWVE